MRKVLQLMAYHLARALEGCPLVLPQDQRALRLWAVKLAEELDE